MAELSTSITRWLLEWLEGHAVSGVAWSEGICEPEELIEPDGFISWETFAALCDRLTEWSEARSDETPRIASPREIGRDIAEVIFSGENAAFPIDDIPIELIYIERLPSAAREVFSDLVVHADIASDGEVILFEVAMPGAGLDCPAFFQMIQGGLEAIPLLLDHEPADVAIEQSSGHARYAIRIPGLFENVIPLDAVLDDAAHDLVIRDEVDLDFALSKADAARNAPRPAEGAYHAPHAATSLDFGAILRDLAACRTTEEAVERIFATLREHFDSSAARMWLDRDCASRANPLDPAYVFGQSDKPPSHTLQLAVAGEIIGRLEIWDASPLDANDLRDLDALTPGFGLALEALNRENEANPDDLLAPILDGTRDACEDRLVSVVRILAEQTRADKASICLLQPNQPMLLQSLVCWRDNQVDDSFEYDARGTPCARVLGGEIACYPVAVHRHFEADVLFAENKTQSYLGAPLRDRAGSIIGVLCSWGGHPLDDSEQAGRLIRLLADRAETELQYRQIAQAHELDVARYRGFHASSHDLLVEVGINGKLFAVSPNAEQLLGYTSDSPPIPNYEELIHPDDLAAHRESIVALAREPGSLSLAIRLRHADRGWRWFDVRIRSVPAPDGSLRLLAAARDSGERVALEQERDELTSIIQRSSDLIAMLSLKGEVLFLNESGLRLLGLSSDDEARTKTVYDLIHDDDARAMKFEIMPGIHRRSRWDGDIRLRHFKTGRQLSTVASLFMLEDRRANRSVAIALICRDETVQRERDQALIETEERYRMLAENPFELVSEIDEHGQVIYASPTFETIMGYSPESLLGTSCFELMHPEDRDRLRESLAKTIDEQSTLHGEHRLIHADGRYRWIESTVRAYRGLNERRMAVLIARDVTERVESSETLKQTQQKLQQSQKMEAIGRMAGGVAHDFNNLLTAITGFCDLMIEDLSPQHPAHSDASEILKAAERAAGLTHQLLAFSRRQLLQPRVVDPNNLVADLDRMLRRLIGEEVELVTLLDGAAWPTKADPVQLQQVVLNLVVNARDAMPKGGRITIETGNATLTQDLASDIDEIPPGDYVKVAVSDTGEGMSREIQSMIFEPFFTTKESGKGTGLGLSTVIGIVQQSGGYIDVDSTAGRGTCFTIYLPRADSLPMLPETHVVPEQFGGTETVLVVEDSDPVRKLIVRCLERQGYTVLEGASGTEALRISNRHNGPIQLVLCDVILPKMDGFEVVKRLHAMRPDTRVIYMSGFTDDGLLKHGVDIQDIALIEKPFTPSTLLRTVREYLDVGTIPIPPVRVLPEDDGQR